LTQSRHNRPITIVDPLTHSS